MPTSNPQAVMELLDAAFTSASVGAALELGLFWLIDGRAMPVEAIAGRLRVRPAPCAYWLQLLGLAGFVEEGPDGYRASARARASIIQAYRPETWALLAQEARERLPILLDFPNALRSAEGLSARLDYVALMQASPERARRFTRMLYELHRASAEAFAARIDVAGVRRLIDIGGGSGVVSMALVDRHPGLEAVVVDVANVCDAGRELAAERGLGGHVTYYPADFTADALPDGFDLALMCDVGVYSRSLFLRIADALVPGGRLMIADAFAPSQTVASPSRAHWALEQALFGTAPAATASHVEGSLREAGFVVGRRTTVLPEGSEMALILTATRR